jgi:hypothetical protein
LAREPPCTVSLIGVGFGGTSFGEHTLASFPTHDLKEKKIAWAWIKKEKRPRRVAIAEIQSGDMSAYVLEIERINQEQTVISEKALRALGHHRVRVNLR